MVSGDALGVLLALGDGLAGWLEELSDASATGLGVSVPQALVSVVTRKIAETATSRPVRRRSFMLL